jgi:UDP-N-acetylglucosamine 2-epimerase (non-hydrolysing)
MLEPVLKKERPHLVLVHGDTTTALMAALAAFYQGIPVGHVEAGLRSHNVAHPYPEEMNRRLVDGIAALHFAPTREASRNLRREGLPARGIFITGNTGIDALHLGLKRLKNPSRLPGTLGRIAQNPFVLVTAHRRENFGGPFKEVFQALRTVALQRPQLGFIYPVHPNPAVQGPARAWLGGLPNVCLTPPLPYGTMLVLLQRCRFVVTDSGGLQEEAPSLGLRQVTERPEAVRAGTVRLVGTKEPAVRRSVAELLDNPRLFRRMAQAVNPYGDGHACERIVQALRHFFDPGCRRPEGFLPRARMQRVGPLSQKIQTPP